MWGRSGAEWGPTFSFLTPPRRRGAPGGKVHSSAVITVCQEIYIRGQGVQGLVTMFCEFAGGRMDYH